MKRAGLDLGSTTVKCVVVDEENNIVFSKYERHMSRISETTSEMLYEVAQKFNNEKMLISISGSAGMGMAEQINVPFIQEVYATRTSVKKLAPGTNVVIELGGEDAKILFLTDGLEVRMNGSCAGGTGAFISQMASLMSVEADELNSMAEKHEKIYQIASRCGVFAKTDIQPLINQGARKEDIAASIFYAVVNQTVAGLAQGRDIQGNVLYLGGPLTFFPQLRIAFDKTLKIDGKCPENSLYFVALGAAYSPSAQEMDIMALADTIKNYSSTVHYTGCKPLFTSKEDYDEFINRHNLNSQGIKTITKPSGKMYLGVDSGSTTIKALLCDENGNILKPYYHLNSGNPVPLVREYLKSIYEEFPDVEIVSSAVTGYGEDIIKNAFHMDVGVVETVAHFTAASRFCPNVDFIIDIGGQDIKCFRMHNGAIDSIFLNEACSSGCGSFLQTFATILGYSSEEFSKLGLFAKAPVDLGSRCTVFMNSSVKQAQKDGASVEDISAGLSISVVKNALYKVIRCADSESLGKNIVVQGGTFLNDAVLRAFEQEIGKDVIRPSVSGLMGAYGAALYAMQTTDKNAKSSVLNLQELENFSHTVKAISCKGCSNNCRLTINTFGDGRKYIAGNRCEKPLNLPMPMAKYDIYTYKNELLMKYRKNECDENKQTVGLPMGLNMYELLPFWYTIFDDLGFNVVVSGVSNRKMYVRGQHTIPSDTACYPAKLVHGHIEDLLDRNVDIIFYPGMSYNVDEQNGDNYYNCPVVAYYPQLIKANVKALANVKYICDFIGLKNRKKFVSRFVEIMKQYGYKFSRGKVKKAMEHAFSEYDEHMRAVREKADEYIQMAKREDIPVVVLASRPYHIDPEICHGINNIITSLGAIVLTEDSVAYRALGTGTNVLNQWTYHSRLYSAAKYVASEKDMDINLVQLVSFGCGVDAVTTDEARAIVEEAGKFYTQIKIDEISNLGAVKIRLRSLFAIMNKKQIGDKKC